MRVSVCIATYGSEDWHDLAWSRAYPSAMEQGALEVNCFHDPEGSIASVRNELARTAKGEWLCFLDADDELAPGYLGAMKRAYEQERGTDGGSLLLTPAVSYVHKGRPKPPKFWPECDFTTGNWVVIGTLVRRDFFTEVGGFRDFAHGLEDWNLWARCVRAGARVVKVRSAVYLAHWNSRSKHMKLAANRPAYSQEYAAAQTDAWG
jgi:glycosyltransferase involved in cell wall biosynthesis